MSEEAWYAFDGGGTIGAAGSEDGVIMRDDEHANGARITLERDSTIAPFAITCGIYGAMVHTRWFSSEAQAQHDYDAMKQALDAIIRGPLENDQNFTAGTKTSSEAIEEFVERFP